MIKRKCYINFISFWGAVIIEDDGFSITVWFREAASTFGSLITISDNLTHLRKAVVTLFFTFFSPFRYAVFFSTFLSRRNRSDCHFHRLKKPLHGKAPLNQWINEKWKEEGPLAVQLSALSDFSFWIVLHSFWICLLFFHNNTVTTVCLKKLNLQKPVNG